MFWYVSNHDYEEADDYNGMMPTVNASVGPSGTELDELQKVFYTLAAMLLAAGLPATAVGAEQSSLTLLFTGDNGGEIAPCG